MSAYSDEEITGMIATIDLLEFENEQLQITVDNLKADLREAIAEMNDLRWEISNAHIEASEYRENW